MAGNGAKLLEAVESVNALAGRYEIRGLPTTPGAWAAAMSPFQSLGNDGQSDFLDKLDELMVWSTEDVVDREGRIYDRLCDLTGEIWSALVGSDLSAEIILDTQAGPDEADDPFRALWMDGLSPERVDEFRVGLREAVKAVDLRIDWDDRSDLVIVGLREDPTSRIGLDMWKLTRHVGKWPIGRWTAGLGPMLQEVARIAHEPLPPWKRVRRSLRPMVHFMDPKARDYTRSDLDQHDLTTLYAYECGGDTLLVTERARATWGVSVDEVQVAARKNLAHPRPQAIDIFGAPCFLSEQPGASGHMLRLIEQSRDGTAFLVVVMAEDALLWCPLIDDRSVHAALVLRPWVNTWLKDRLGPSGGAGGSDEIFWVRDGQVGSTPTWAADRDRVLSGPTDLIARLSSLTEIPLDDKGNLPLPSLVPPTRVIDTNGRRKALTRLFDHPEFARTIGRGDPIRLVRRADVMAARFQIAEELITGDVGWHLDDVSDPLSSHSPITEYVDRLSDLGSRMIDAIPYLWDEKVRDLAIGLELPTHAVSDDLLPIPLPMWMTWPELLRMESPDETGVGPVPYLVRGVLISPYRGGLKIETVGRRLGVRWAHSMVIPAGSRFPGDLPPHCHLPLALVAFLGAKFVTIGPEPRPMAGGGKIEPPARPDSDEPRFVRLREMRTPSGGQDLGGEGRGGPDWKHRWMVSRHLRLQPYPSTGERRWIWIDPYIKGPSDKPLRVPGYRVAR